MKGGVDVPEFLDGIKDRIGAVHFKDFATDGSAAERKCDPAESGECVAPLDGDRRVAEAQQAPACGSSPSRTTRAFPRARLPRKNAAYLKRVM